ncbi:Histone deacetylase HDT1 [Heracleum sosnowskyi]|uniref:Histone deacetylase HDT1 n=1 Tax=Heracleum sosnowskyi TaxID=360622 RepID=A0AAD8MIR2_9APIA|nr:Histone deacetylase HDT1 [Heracleum sosnowskyi]
MEFWGVEVKAGESLHVVPEEGNLIHISQVALGDVKNPKSANSILVRMEVDDKEIVIGTLSVEKAPQIMFDLVLEKDFTLSHGWKDGSLFFCGYTAAADLEDNGPYGNDFSDEDEDESEDEEEIIEKDKPVAEVEAAVPAKSKAAATKPGTSAKPKVTLVDPKKQDSDDSESSDEDGDDESADEDLDDDEDDDVSEDEETPKKVESSKKRPSTSDIKTPASTKKSKTETPQKTDGKKGAHTATPHPAKKSEKKTSETPKSAQLSCNSCSKTFTSEKGLESHSKAKHGGK